VDWSQDYFKEFEIGWYRKMFGGGGVNLCEAQIYSKKH